MPVISDGGAVANGSKKVLVLSNFTSIFLLLPAVPIVSFVPDSEGGSQPAIRLSLLTYAYLLGEVTCCPDGVFSGPGRDRG